MIPLLGALGGAGAVLIAAPWIWPAGAAAPRVQRAGRIDARLQAAGISGISAAVFLTASVVIGLIAGALSVAATGLAAVGLLAAVVAGLAPWTVAGWRARARIKAARGLWPEVVDHLVASVRAGRPLPDAVADLATAGPAALRRGFALFARRWHETGTAGPAFEAMKTYFADPTADRIVEILRMAREVGGTELPSVLRDLGLHLRQDLALRAEVEARQSWVTNAGKLGLAAPWIVLAMLATRPEAAAAYATPAGTALIVGAAAVTVVAYRAMLMIGRLPEDRRWFR